MLFVTAREVAPVEAVRFCGSPDEVFECVRGYIHFQFAGCVECMWKEVMEGGPSASGNDSSVCAKDIVE